MDRKIARNQDKFEALDFNAAVGDSRMTPASAFVATIRGKLPPSVMVSQRPESVHCVTRVTWREGLEYVCIHALV